MRVNKVIVIGASAGGVEALRELFRGLKAGIPAAVLVVLHIPADAKSLLPEILGRKAAIPVVQAREGQRIEAGHAYVAPPDRHLIIRDQHVHLLFGPKINHTRPAIDPLFESAARQYGPRVIGVVLSGNLHDGTRGLMRIKQGGGVAVVQDPNEAIFADMPASASEFVEIDYSLPIAQIADLLNQLAEQEPDEVEKGEFRLDESEPDYLGDEIELIKHDLENFEQGYSYNQRSVLTCPDCGGLLWELQDEQLVRYRCHTGHVYTAESLLVGYDNEFEKAFWSAIRVLIEKAAISNRMALISKEMGNKEREEKYLNAAKRATSDAIKIRNAWANGKAGEVREQSAGELGNEEVTSTLDEHREDL